MFAPTSSGQQFTVVGQENEIKLIWIGEEEVRLNLQMTLLSR